MLDSRPAIARPAPAQLPSSELLSKDELETDDLGHPVLEIVSATAAEVGQRFGVAEAEGHYALDLKPATVFMASGELGRMQCHLPTVLGCNCRLWAPLRFFKMLDLVWKLGK